MELKRHFSFTCIISLLILLQVETAHSFCGYFVSKAGTNLFNKASKVVLMRDDEKTVITMSNDFQGDVKEFAMVVPVPSILQKSQINVADQKLIDHLDAFTAPRLVEYFDHDPCDQRIYEKSMAFSGSVRSNARGSGARKKGKKNYGVKIEAKYTVGEYDILILSAKESDGLLRWLNDNKYQTSPKAEKVLGSYIKQGMKFFVAKVNLKEQAKLGFTNLRPLQMAFESNKFMLPIRLGMMNAKEKQELFVFGLSRKGRIETTNYRTVKIPSDVELPVYIKDPETFKKFYKDMYYTAARREDHKAVFMEYAWDMGWCDPCAADPLSDDELRKLGAFWLGGDNNKPSANPLKRRRIMPRGQKPFVTRLHLTYDATTHPDDLRFQVTSDKKNFQGRYILRHPFKGDSKCEEMTRYQKTLKSRFEKESTTLAHLTGWDINDIRKKMNYTPSGTKTNDKNPNWWDKVWN